MEIWYSSCGQSSAVSQAGEGSWYRHEAQAKVQETIMGSGLIRCDLTLETYFTYGNAASVITRAVLPRRQGQPIFMRGEVGIKEDGRLRPLVAHNTTHIDMPLHFIEGAADLHEVLDNPAYRINMPMLARVLDLSAWPEPSHMYEIDGVRYCEQVSVDMLPTVEELRQYDALVLLTGFGAVMRRGSEQYQTDAEGFYHLPHITVEAARRVAEAGLSLLAIDCTTLERQTQGHPFRMAGDVHPILLGHEPPVFILEGVAGDRIAQQVGFLPAEAMLEVIPRRTNPQGAEAAHARVFLSFYRGADNRQQLRRLLDMVTPEYLYG
jgi:kynurenine formamidase